MEIASSNLALTTIKLLTILKDKTMNLKRKCQVILLPTDDKYGSSIMLGVMPNVATLTKDVLNDTHDWMKFGKSQHLYILSDEKIEEGDWFYYPKSYKNINLCNLRDYKYLTDKCNNNWLAESCKKIIAATDKSLNLPEPSPEFIQKYIEAYNSGNPIIEVVVEYIYKNKVTFGNCIYKEINRDGSYYELINGEVEKTLSIKELESYGITMYEPKVNKSNQISITKVKDSWSREEVSDLILKIIKEISYGNDYLLEHYSGDFKDAKKWISENL